MKRKYFIIILIFCLIISVSFTIVRAEQVETSDVTDREMAIACALSYVPLREGKTMAQNFNIGQFKLISKVVNDINSKFNLHDYATIHELDEWKVADFRNKEFSEKSMAAFVLEKDNNLIIIFRGTDFEALADVAYGLTNYHNQEEYADKYVLEILEKYGAKNENYTIYVAGHSLGGYLAQTAGAELARNIKNYDNLELGRIVTFNGIGINFLTYLGDKYNYGNQQENIETLISLSDEEKLIEYYVYGDVVSALGVHYGEMRMMLPSIDSITYHRTNYKLLEDLNKKIKLSETLSGFVERDTLNIFKTDIYNAKDLYQLNDSMVAFLNLTHEADAFATIETEKSDNPPEVKIAESKGLLTEVKDYFLSKNNGIEKLEIKKSTKIKAITSYASVKKYEWYVSNDKQNWKLIKTSTIDVNDTAYNEKEQPTNTLDININDFKQGETKYYKVVSYYNDNYISSRYHYNEDKAQYEYIEDEIQRHQEENETVEKVIEVRREKENNIKTKIISGLRNLKKLFSIWR